MAFPPDLPHFLGRRLSRRRRRRSRGSALVQALMAALIALIGGLLLASRLFSSRFNSFSRSDTLAAREAAEFGLNELQARLNTDQQGYLWVTKRSSWGANGLLSALNTCNVQALDNNGDQLTALPALPAGITTPRTIRTDADTTITYQLTAFEPPSLPDNQTATVNQVGFCGEGNGTAAANFGNLNGGSALITVTGTVTRGGNQTQFRLSRRPHVMASAGTEAENQAVSFVILGNAYNATCKDGKNSIPGCTPDPTPIDPPVFGAFSDITRLNVLDGNICYGTSAGCSTPLALTLIGCADLDSCIVNNVDTVKDKTRKGLCTQKIKGQKKQKVVCNEFQQATPVAMPASYQATTAQWNTLRRPMTCDTSDKNKVSKCQGNNSTSSLASLFPFYNTSTVPTDIATMTNANLVRGCYFSSTRNLVGPALLTTAAGSNNVSIDCFFEGREIKNGKVDEFIDGKNNLVVETGPLPVNFFLYDVQRDGNNYAYELDDAGIQNSNPNAWSRLRILGEPPMAVNAGDPISCGRTRIINTKNDSNIDGAFIWLPNGWLEYAKTDSKDTSLNVIWTCKFSAPTKKDKGYQLVTPPEADVRAALQLSLPGFTATSAGVYRAYGSEDVPAP